MDVIVQGRKFNHKNRDYLCNSNTTSKHTSKADLRDIDNIQSDGATHHYNSSTVKKVMQSKGTEMSFRQDKGAE